MWTQRVRTDRDRPSGRHALRPARAAALLGRRVAPAELDRLLDERYSGDDAFLVPLIASDGRRLAVLSLDEPVDGRRPYRLALGETEARAELVRGAGTQFDADVVAALLRVL